MDSITLPKRVAAHLAELRQAVQDAQKAYNQCAFVALLGQEIDLREIPTTKVNIAPDGEVTFIETPVDKKIKPA
jgi:hypothetical protein